MNGFWSGVSMKNNFRSYKDNFQNSEKDKNVEFDNFCYRIREISFSYFINHGIKATGHKIIHH